MLSLPLLPAKGNSAGRLAVEQAGGLLAGEGNCLRTIVCDFASQTCDVGRISCELMIHARLGLVQIGEPDSERQQCVEFAGVIPLRREACLMDRAPEAI